LIGRRAGTLGTQHRVYPIQVDRPALQQVALVILLRATDAARWLRRGRWRRRLGWRIRRRWSRCTDVSVLEKRVYATFQHDNIRGWQNGLPPYRKFCAIRSHFSESVLILHGKLAAQGQLKGRYALEIQQDAGQRAVGCKLHGGAPVGLLHEG